MTHNDIRQTAALAERHWNKRRSGYPKVTVTRPNGARRAIWEHIAIAERVLGRMLPKGAHIHHVDGDGWNNDHKNLVVCQDAAYHKLLHARADVVRAGGNPNTEKLCRSCSLVKPFSEFNRKKLNVNLGLGSDCRQCATARTHQWRDSVRDAIRKERALWIESVTQLAARWRRLDAETGFPAYAKTAAALEAIVARRQKARCGIPNPRRAARRLEARSK